jgi:folylpolyglutamate synthase/dihydropteroate synthase
MSVDDKILMQRLGLDKRLDELNVVHVAGTKGKVMPEPFCIE